ncbi:MAG: hypothetical protein R3E32_26100 [Chitinophagales bacterium]
MAKNRNKRKKSSGGAPVKLPPQKYIQTRARKLPFYKCFVNTDWDDTGMAIVIVSRQQGGDKLVVGLYLVDTWCLGLKDTHYHFRMDNFEFDNDLLLDIYNSKHLEVKEIDSEYAQNIIYGAIEYAEDLGFSPHKDFKLTEYILDPSDSIEVIDLEFGKDGMPLYVNGLNDNVEKIIATLERNVGLGNFHYTIGGQTFGEYDDDDFEEEEDFEDNDDDFAEDITYEEV